MTVGHPQRNFHFSRNNHSWLALPNKTNFGYQEPKNTQILSQNHNTQHRYRNTWNKAPMYKLDSHQDFPPIQFKPQSNFQPTNATYSNPPKQSDTENFLELRQSIQQMQNQLNNIISKLPLSMNENTH